MAYRPSAAVVYGPSGVELLALQLIDEDEKLCLHVPADLFSAYLNISNFGNQMQPAKARAKSSSVAQ